MKKITDDANPIDVFASAQNSDNLRKFSDELLENFMGKICEIYIGDQAEVLQFEDYSVPQNCIIYGRLVEILDRFVKLDCYFIDKQTKQLRSGNMVFINAFQIRAMTELNSHGTLNDIFLNAKSSEKVRQAILTGKSGK